MSSELALPTLEETTIAIATPEQVLVLRDLCNKNFSPDFPPEDYKKVWAELPNKPWYDQGRVITWALVRQGQETGEAYALAQTERRDAYSKDHDGKIEKVNLCGVVLVNTPEKYQRRGYCRRLLRTIHYLLCPSENIPPWPQAWGEYPTLPKDINLPKGVASILSSVAPPGHYEKCWIGPDTPENSEKRVGWISKTLKEGNINMDLIWDTFGEYIPNSNDENDEWGHTLVYQNDIPKLQGPLSQEYENRLKGMNNPEKGKKIILPDPASPGWLYFHVEIEARLGMNAVRKSFDSNIPIGIRFYRKSSTANSEIPPFKSSDPIILFQPRLFTHDTITVLLVSNILPSHLDTVIRISKEICSIGEPVGMPVTQLRLWGLSPSSSIVERLVQLGAKVYDRTETLYLPIGVCCYGPPGSTVSVEGYEYWAWC